MRHWDTPVLLLVFNRPDLTARVMDQVRQAEPSKLFVGADGPRPSHPDDADRCRRAREVATQVDWDCEVKTLFREENLGCKQAVSSAITWFFEHVEEGVILEDDCVPHPSFFKYCSLLLDRYRNDDRIRVISGNNFQPDDRTYQASYYFSIYNHCWGWATWQEAWKSYDGEVTEWPALRGTGWLEGWLGSREEAEYWRKIFDSVWQGEVDSWAYPWTFACWKEHGLSTLPAINLVSNIGFGEQATHTKEENGEAGYLPAKPMSFPLEHPTAIARAYEADHFTSKHHFGIQSSESYWRESLRCVMPDQLKTFV